MDKPIQAKTIVWLTIFGTAFLFLVTIASCAGCKEFNRYQKRQDAVNRTKVTKQEIQTARQLALVTRAQIEATKARAEQRYQESIGIKRAQDEISKTLTPLYVQHEAIQKLPGAKAIYVPSGAQGIPQVYDIGKNP